MPELAEVEFFRKQWQGGMNQKILAVELHPNTRLFRGTDTKALQEALTGAALKSSEAHGKQMFFHFSKGALLGVHLGMTGKLHAEPSDYAAAKHDHLVLRQKTRSLVFTDPRQFGRVRFHSGKALPTWRASLPAQVLSDEFTRSLVEKFLARHGRMPIKAVLLMQNGFPGVGNWMADEILWRARIYPGRIASKVKLVEVAKLYRETKYVCRESMRTVSADFGDPPKNWLFHVRWRRGGDCPRDGSALTHAEIGGRTTCWCPSCQK